MNTSFSFMSKAFLFIILPFYVQAQSVKLVPDYPSTIKPGEQFIMAVRITKGQAANAARLQLEVPTGFDAKVVNARGGDFSFQNNTVKFFWPTLPDAAEFTVSCNLIPSATLKGKQTITGEFIYGDGDKSEHVPLRPCIVNITGTEQSNADAKSPKVERKIINGNPQKTEYRVELTFTPNGVTESAQFTDILPADYSAFIIDAHEASYSLENQSVIFTWKKLPSEKSFVVSYLVRSATPGPTPVFNGTLTYGDAIEINTPTSASINSVTPENESSPAEPAYDQNSDAGKQATNETESSNTQSTPTEFKSAPDQASSVNRDIEQSSSSSTKQPDNKPSTTEQASNNSTDQSIAMATSENKQAESSAISNSGIVFRIQISATQKSPARSTEWFQSNLKINSPVEMTIQEGWKKYLIGNFNSVEQAIKVQNTTREKVSDAFIVAYQNGVRIPVSDAIRNKAFNQ